MKKDSHEKLRKLAGEWFFKAQEDELSIKDILEDKQGAASTVCFLSQQMAEKYLKGYLVFQRKRFPKIHDLANLLKLCEEIDSEFADLTSGVQYLRPFYIATRYPGDYPQFSFKEAEEAFKAATKVKDFVLDKIQNYA